MPRDKQVNRAMPREKQVNLRQALAALLDLDEPEVVLQRFKACSSLVSSHGADFAELADESVVAHMEIHIKKVYGNISRPAQSALNTLRKGPWKMSLPHLFVIFGERIKQGDSEGMAGKLRRAMNRGWRFEEVHAEMRAIQVAREKSSSKAKWQWRPSDVEEAMKQLALKAQPGLQGQSVLQEQPSSATKKARKRRKVKEVHGSDDEEEETSIDMADQELDHHTEVEDNIIDEYHHIDDDSEAHEPGQSPPSVEKARANIPPLSDSSSMLEATPGLSHEEGDSTDLMEATVLYSRNDGLVCTTTHLPHALDDFTLADLALVAPVQAGTAAPAVVDELQQHLLATTTLRLFDIRSLHAPASISIAHAMTLDSEDLNAALDVLSANDPASTSLPLPVIRLLLESFAPFGTQIVRPGSLRVGTDAVAPTAGEEQHHQERFFLPIQHYQHNGHYNNWSFSTVTKLDDECFIQQCCLGVNEDSAEEVRHAVESFCTTMLGFNAGSIRHCTAIDARKDSSTVSMLLHAPFVMLHTFDPSGSLDLVVYARLLAHALQSTFHPNPRRPDYEVPRPPQIPGVPSNTRNMLQTLRNNIQAYLQEAEGFITASRRRQHTCIQVEAMARTLTMQIDVTRRLTGPPIYGVPLTDAQRQNLLQDLPRNDLRKAILQALCEECVRVAGMIREDLAAVTLDMASAKTNLPNGD